MTEREVHLELSNIKIDNDNLDYIKMTGEICGKLRDDLVKLFAIPVVSNSVNCETCKYLGKEHDRYCDNCNSKNSLYEAINDC